MGQQIVVSIRGGRRWRAWSRLGWLLLSTVLFLLTAVRGTSATPGELTQRAGTDGCVSEEGSSNDCADGKALVSPFGVAVSPDGRCQR